MPTRQTAYNKIHTLMTIIRMVTATTNSTRILIFPSIVIPPNIYLLCNCLGEKHISYPSERPRCDVWLTTKTILCPL